MYTVKEVRYPHSLLYDYTWELIYHNSIIVSNPPIMDMSVHVSQQSIPETSDDVSYFVTVTPVSPPSR